MTDAARRKLVRNADATPPPGGRKLTSYWLDDPQGRDASPTPPGDGNKSALHCRQRSMDTFPTPHGDGNKKNLDREILAE